MAKLSIGVLTFNRAGYLVRTLASLMDDPVTVIYDNGSTDTTRQWLKGDNVVFNPTNNHTVGYGMNRVIEHCVKDKSDIILFSADDYVYSIGWAKRLIAFWEAAPENVKLVNANLEPLYPWNEITGLVDYGGQHGITRTSLGGSQWSFRASDIDLIYPVRETTGGEDLEICKRLITSGYQLVSLDLSEHIGEKQSAWGNESWRYAIPLDKRALGFGENVV